MRFMVPVPASRESEADDFGAEFTPELTERGSRPWAQIASEGTASSERRCDSEHWRQEMAATLRRWLDVLNRFLERAFRSADIETGC